MKLCERSAPFALLAAAWFALAGCGDRAPIVLGLQPVHGTVLGADGNPVSGGWVTFKGPSAPGTIVQGEIGKDGTFSLETRTGSKKEPGVCVAPGYTVYIKLADGVTNYWLKKQFEVKAGDNHFTIQLIRSAYYP